MGLETLESNRAGFEESFLGLNPYFRQSPKSMKIAQDVMNS